MKVGVWGAGNVGTPLVWRLAASSFVTEIRWTNRTYNLVNHRGMDVRQGLALSLSCRDVTTFEQEHVSSNFSTCDIVVLTQGKAVPKGKQRLDVLADNVRIAGEAGRALRTFSGVVLAVTNPLDITTRVVWQEMERPDPARVIGLGTVVETARLRAAVASELDPPRHPCDGQGLVIGTHDTSCVCLFQSPPAPGAKSLTRSQKESIRTTVRNAARQVRAGPSEVATVYPIVEGIIAVCRTVATDSHHTHTVSTLDVESAEELFYSVPCLLGRSGVVARCMPLLTGNDRSEFDDCLRTLGRSLEEADKHKR